nr:DUF58 domain-containing protein [Pseudomonas sp. MMS21 TM103]
MVARAPGTATATGVAAGAYVDLQQLVALRRHANDLALGSRQPAHSLSAGRHATRLRGRGLSFEELRPYWAGDDARLIDWKVTARLRRPFLRLFTEERDRPVLLVVDQRMNQFFGSQRAFKSVIAAEVAALLGWAGLARHDRVGAILFDDQRCRELRPGRGDRSFLHLLRCLVQQNQALHALNPGDAPQQLNAALGLALRLARHDHQVVLISDFYGMDAHTRALLTQLRRHNEVLACWTQDPLLTGLSPSDDLVVSDGRLQMTLDFGRAELRQALGRMREQRSEEIFAWADGLGIPLLPVSTAEPVAEQLRGLLGPVQAGSVRRG